MSMCAVFTLSLFTDVAEVRREFGISEHVALVLCGTNTRVAVHLTTELDQIQAALGSSKTKNMLGCKIVR